MGALSATIERNGQPASVTLQILSFTQRCLKGLRGSGVLYPGASQCYGSGRGIGALEHRDALAMLIQRRSSDSQSGMLRHRG